MQRTTSSGGGSWPFQGVGLTFHGRQQGVQNFHAPQQRFVQPLTMADGRPYMVSGVICDVWIQSRLTLNICSQCVPAFPQDI